MDYTLTIKTTVGGTTDPIPGNYIYPQNSQITALALPDTEYLFDYWLVTESSGTAKYYGNPISGQITSDTTLEAYFKAIPKNYTLTITTTVGGTTDPIPNTYVYSEGTKISVLAVPDLGYLFAYFKASYGGIIESHYENPIVGTLTEDLALEAHFTLETPPQVTLTISATEGGITNPASGIYSYVEGTKVTLEAFPNSGYFFSHWLATLANGTTETSTMNPLTIVMPAENIVIQAIFTSQVPTPPPHPPFPSANMQGVVWYGIDTGHPEWYNFNQNFFYFLEQTFQKMNLLLMMISVPYDENKIIWVDQVIEWCKPYGIQLLIVNAADTLDEDALIAFWTQMAQKYKDNPNVYAFDLINEPWAFAQGDETIVQLYERIIDAIRAVDPNRMCHVQSMYPHPLGFFWVRTNPVQRSNVVYAHHLYNADWASGMWYPAETCPWNPYYLNHDYATAKEVLRNGAGTALGLYQRVGFLKAELGLPIAVTEVAFTPTPEGLQYGKDLLNILNEYEADWTYNSWYSSVDRPMNLTTPDGLLRDDIYKVVQEAMGITQHTLTILSSTGGTTDPPPSVLTLDAGTVQPVVPLPAPGYRHVHWLFDGAIQDVWWPAGSTINITMDADHTVQPVFELITRHSLIIIAATGGTTLPSPGTYELAEGTAALVSAIPDASYRFVHWELDETIRTENPIIIVMDKAHSLRAVFEYVPPPPTTADIQGTVTDKAGSPLAGATVTCNGFADITEVDGAFQFLGIEPKRYTVTASKEGYVSQAFIVVLQAGTTVTLSFVLSTSPAPGVNLLPLALLAGLVLIALKR